MEIIGAIIVCGVTAYVIRWWGGLGISIPELGGVYAGLEDTINDVANKVEYIIDAETEVDYNDKENSR